MERREEEIWEGVESGEERRGGRFRTLCHHFHCISLHLISGNILLIVLKLLVYYKTHHMEQLINVVWKT